MCQHLEPPFNWRPDSPSTILLWLIQRAVLIIKSEQVMIRLRSSPILSVSSVTLRSGVTIGIILVAALLGWLGRRSIQKGTPPVPEQAIAEAKLTTEALKGNGRH